MTPDDEKRLSEIRAKTHTEFDAVFVLQNVPLLLRLYDDSDRARIAAEAALATLELRAVNAVAASIEARRAIDAAMQRIAALEAGFATPSTASQGTDGTSFSVPGNAWDVIHQDRDEWKRRCGKVEALVSEERAKREATERELARLRSFSSRCLEERRLARDAATFRAEQAEAALAEERHHLVEGRSAFEEVDRELRDERAKREAAETRLSEKMDQWDRTHDSLHNELTAQVADLKERLAPFEALAAAPPWEDTPLPEDAAIDAAHPLETKRHDLFNEAMRLVGARQSKGGLVELVNWLLVERASFQALVDAARRFRFGRLCVRPDEIGASPPGGRWEVTDHKTAHCGLSRDEAIALARELAAKEGA